MKSQDILGILIEERARLEAMHFEANIGPNTALERHLWGRLGEVDALLEIMGAKLPRLEFPEGSEIPICEGLLTTAHSGSSYGIPVWLYEGTAYGSGDPDPIPCPPELDFLAPLPEQSVGDMIRARARNMWGSNEECWPLTVVRFLAA